MTDFRDQGSAGRPNLARELIAAGRGERAGRAARLLAADALLTAGVSAPGVAPAVAWLTTLKWLGVSVLVLGAAGLASYATSDGAVRPIGSVAAPLSPAPPAHRDIPCQAAAVAAPAPLPPAVPSQPRPRVTAALPRPVEVAPAARVVARDVRLREELDALRAARQAVAAGSPAHALAVLDAKAHGFSLLPVEAGIVRIEALRSAGDEDRARRLARDLLREHSAGPYAERLKALVPE